jgi:chromosome segregation ATPase
VDLLAVAIRRLEKHVGQHAVAERSRQIADERAALEEIKGHLLADEKSVVSDLAALSAERDELERDLACAHERLASLDAEIAAQQLGEWTKTRELDATRHELERDRDQVARIEQELLRYRQQTATAQESLGDLVKSILRIQHKLWRAATDPTKQD